MILNWEGGEEDDGGEENHDNSEEGNEDDDGGKHDKNMRETTLNLLGALMTWARDVPPVIFAT